ncbi:MAG: WD40 repeat domain-containing protein [Planctomycetota bacterium]|jgi:WD40 repeat protein
MVALVALVVSSPTLPGQEGPTTGIETFTPKSLPRNAPHELDGVDQVAFSADGESLYVAAHRTGGLRLTGRKPSTYWIEQWDLTAWTKRATVDDLAAPFVKLGDGETIVALPAEVAQDGPYHTSTGKVAVYDIKTQHIARHFDVDLGYVFGIAASPDGQAVVLCSKEYSTDRPRRWINGHIISWSVDGRKQWEHRWDSGRVSVVDWSPDGSLVFGAGSDGVIAWKAESGQAAWEYHDHPNDVESLVCSDDGRYVVTGSYFDPSSGFGFLGRPYSVVKIRNAKDGKPVRTVKLYHEGIVRPLDLAIAPAGRSIAVALGSYNRGQHWGEVRIVDMESGETKATLLKDHSQPVTSVAYSPKGQILAAGTFDGLVALWRIEPDDQTVVDGVLAEMIGHVLFGDDFLDGLAESIERGFREKLQFKSEMEWQLLGHVDDLIERVTNDDGRCVILIHLMLPSDEPQRSKTIVLNTSDDATPFLRLTRSYGLVTSPTAIIGIAAQSSDSRIVSGETSLTWNTDRWVEVKSDAIRQTIE